MCDDSGNSDNEEAVVLEEYNLENYDEDGEGEIESKNYDINVCSKYFCYIYICINSFNLVLEAMCTDVRTCKQ